MVLYGYLRVSTEKQNVDNYRASILEFCQSHNLLEKIIWISETVSGRVKWENRDLGIIFKQMYKGDIIITAEYSRIGRDMLNSLSFFQKCREMGITVYSVNGDIPLTSDANGTLMLSLAAWKSQTEREMIASRTRVGLQAAKSRGVILGRKQGCILDKDPNNLERITMELKMGIKLIKIAENHGVTPRTISKYIKLHNLKPYKSDPKNIQSL